MNSQLTYKCSLKEWELVKRFSSPQTMQLGAWIIICHYHKKTPLNPKYKTIKSVEINTYRHNYIFYVNCSDSYLELTYKRNRFVTAVHFLISLSLTTLSTIGIFTGTYGGIFGGLFGIAICALINLFEIRLKKKAFSILNEYIQKNIL